LFRIIVILPLNCLSKMKNTLFFCFIFIFSGLWAQQTPVQTDSIYSPDPYYLEDQLYFGISYSVLKNLPENMRQNGFSNAVKFGFIRDIPINERRNIGIGIGAGLSWETFFQNLLVRIDEQTGDIQYNILPDGTYTSNSLKLKKIDVPFEFRWRGSTPEKYKFWRLYAGITTSYVYGTSSNFVTDKFDITYNGIKIIKKWQFGIDISAGYGTWNFNFYYGLSNILKDNVNLNNQNLDIKSMRFGIVYYFL